MQTVTASLEILDGLNNDPATCRMLLNHLSNILADERLRFMEVCGTHTVSIFQTGLRSLLPENVIHLSGPGCPVCVTHEAEIALAHMLAAQENTIVATFGDLLRVPDAEGLSMKHLRAAGLHIEVVYSPMDAVTLAKMHPDKEVVFIGIGFETTAPAVAASIISAEKDKISNFSVLSFHKLIPPAIKALLEQGELQIDAFLLPGHVATITGMAPFTFLAREYGLPGVIAGFEATDLLLALTAMAEARRAGRPEVINAYPRAVAKDGNKRARSLMDEVFTIDSTCWRGLGEIPESGLHIKEKYAEYDARKKFRLAFPKITPIKGCRCGDVLKGLIKPDECHLFAKKCTPASPVGPCMVSTEGSCAAWYKYV